jgi:hypothetical protein
MLCSSLELIKGLVDAQLLHELVDEHSLLDISALSFLLVVPRLLAAGFTGFLVWLLVTQLAISIIILLLFVGDLDRCFVDDALGHLVRFRVQDLNGIQRDVSVGRPIWLAHSLCVPSIQRLYVSVGVLVVGDQLVLCQLLLCVVLLIGDHILLKLTFS